MYTYIHMYILYIFRYTYIHIYIYIYITGWSIFCSGVRGADIPLFVHYFSKFLILHDMHDMGTSTNQPLFEQGGAPPVISWFIIPITIDIIPINPNVIVLINQLNANELGHHLEGIINFATLLVKRKSGNPFTIFWWTFRPFQGPQRCC